MIWVYFRLINDSWSENIILIGKYRKVVIMKCDILLIYDFVNCECDL